MNSKPLRSSGKADRSTPESESRREFIRRLAKASVAVPVVAAVSLKIPKAMAY